MKRKRKEKCTKCKGYGVVYYDNSNKVKCICQICMGTGKKQKT